MGWAFFNLPCDIGWVEPLAFLEMERAAEWPQLISLQARGSAFAFAQKVKQTAGFAKKISWKIKYDYLKFIAEHYFLETI